MAAASSVQWSSPNSCQVRLTRDPEPAMTGLLSSLCTASHTSKRPLSTPGLIRMLGPASLLPRPTLPIDSLLPSKLAQQIGGHPERWPPGKHHRLTKVSYHLSSTILRANLPSAVSSTAKYTP